MKYSDTVSDEFAVQAPAASLESTQALYQAKASGRTRICTAPG